MRKTALILLSIGSVLLLGAQSAKNQERKLFLSKTQKNTVAKFLARAASDEHHYVLTAYPLKEAITSVSISVKSDESGYLVEGGHQGTCIDQFCLVAGKNHPEAFHGVLYQDDNNEEISPSPVFANLSPIAMNRFKGTSHSRSLVESTGAVADEAKTIVGILSGEEAINAQGDKILERRKDASKKLAREYLRQQYEKLGYTVREMPFSAGRLGEAVNLVAEKEGSEKGFFLVSAHYDSVNCPGADDDATGVATSLIIAKGLSGQKLKYGVKFVAFDQEEVGLLGSRAYAKHLKTQGQIDDLRGVFHVEMTGYNPSSHNSIHIIDCEENTSAQLSKLVVEAIQDQGFPLKRVEACTDRSDHSSFWQYNRPAIVVSQNFFGGDGNPCYHKQCDRQKSLDHEYLAQIAQALLGAVSRAVLP